MHERFGRREAQPALLGLPRLRGVFGKITEPSGRNLWPPGRRSGQPFPSSGLPWLTGLFSITDTQPKVGKPSLTGTNPATSPTRPEPFASACGKIVPDMASPQTVEQSNPSTGIPFQRARKASPAPVIPAADPGKTLDASPTAEEAKPRLSFRDAVQSVRTSTAKSQGSPQAASLSRGSSLARDGSKIASVVLPSDLQRVIVTESLVVESPVISPALFRQVSMHRVKSMEERSPSRLRRLSSASSQLSSTPATPTAQALQPPIEESLPRKFLFAAFPGQGAAQLALSEEMSLTTRTQSSPDINVVEFESRTERLLNQHRRLEEHNFKGTPTPRHLNVKLGDNSPRAPPPASPKRPPSASPSLNPIPSRRVVDFSATKQAHTEHNTTGTPKKGAFVRRLICCFGGDGGGVKEGAETPNDVQASANSFAAPMDGSAATGVVVEGPLPLTTADLLRKSITLMSSTGSRTLTPGLVTDPHLQGRLASGQLLQEDEAEVVVVQSATVIKKSPSSADVSGLGSGGPIKEEAAAVRAMLEGKDNTRQGDSSPELQGAKKAAKRSYSTLAAERNAHEGGIDKLGPVNVPEVAMDGEPLTRPGSESKIMPMQRQVGYEAKEVTAPPGDAEPASLASSPPPKPAAEKPRQGSDESIAAAAEKSIKMRLRTAASTNTAAQQAVGFATNIPEESVGAGVVEGLDPRGNDGPRNAIKHEGSMGMETAMPPAIGSTDFSEADIKADVKRLFREAEAKKKGWEATLGPKRDQYGLRTPTSPRSTSSSTFAPANPFTTSTYIPENWTSKPAPKPKVQPKTAKELEREAKMLANRKPLYQAPPARQAAPQRTLSTGKEPSPSAISVEARTG